MIEQALTLPCGHVLPNRIAKAAMTEGLADGRDNATPAHARLYALWAAGGPALLLSGNIQVDRRYLERAGNVVADGRSALAPLGHWAAAVHAQGGQLWAQLNHPGRQCPRSIHAEPLAPSAVPLRALGWFGSPRAATADEVADIVRCFADAAGLCREAGFDGVQIHAAHGYLLSQFLSPRTNLRQDDWGGSLERRARLLLAVVAAVRQRVGARCPISVKLNSDDFVKGGFSLDDSLQVVRWLDDAGVDLLEVSGGTFEQVAWLQADGSREREAMFQVQARAIKTVARMPVMLTGGFRSRAGMQAALAEGAADVLGLARPFCLDPQFPARLLSGALQRLPSAEARLALGAGRWGPASDSTTVRAANHLAQAAWYYFQIKRLAAGLPIVPGLGARQALLMHLAGDADRALRRKLVQS
jgi:2,4-dienoyl-CoA reductase-like NADH-dependent reductase (Old Yellow Enzyme family)